MLKISNKNKTTDYMTLRISQEFIFNQRPVNIKLKTVLLNNLPKNHQQKLFDPKKPQRSLILLKWNKLHQMKYL